MRGGGARQGILRSFITSKKLETVTFERQRQYNLLFGRFEADQRKVCE